MEDRINKLSFFSSIAWFASSICTLCTSRLYNDQTRTNLELVSVGSVCLLCVNVVVLFKTCNVQRLTINLHQNTETQINAVKDVLDGYTTVNETEDDYCSVCMDTKKERSCTLNSCGHVFHSKCIQEWFLVRGRTYNFVNFRFILQCPLCRQSLIR